MIRFRFLGVFLILMVSLIGCTSTKKIQTSLVEDKQSIAYLMDSELVQNKLNYSINVDRIQFSEGVKDEVEVIKSTGFIIPLLVFNYWESKKICFQGNNLFVGDLRDELKYAFVREANRSGVFKVDTSTTESIYDLTINIEEFSAVGPYMSQGYYVFAMFIYVYSFGNYAGPAETQIKLNYTLSKNGVVVKENNFTHSKTTEQLKKGYKNGKELIRGFATSMAEASSNNVKSGYEDLVQDLNEYFNSEK